MARTMINITLLLALLFFADKAYNTHISETNGAIFGIEKSSFRAQALRTMPGITPLLAAAKPVQNYSAVHENDLFRIEREEYIPPEIPEVVEVVLPLPDKKVRKPSVILYGVMKIGDINYALMEDPTLPPALSGGKKYKVGDTIHGFTVKRILPKKVVVNKEESSFEIQLYEKRKGKVTTVSSAKKSRMKRKKKEKAKKAKAGNVKAIENKAAKGGSEKKPAKPQTKEEKRKIRIDFIRKHFGGL